MTTLAAEALVFVAPGKVEHQTETLPPIGPDQVLVQARLSAISAGTEMLVYRGLAPTELESDSLLPALQGSLEFPLKYGYSMVGQVREVGAEVDPSWLKRMVFAFHPHQNFFLARTQDLIALPPDMDAETAIFLPNIETALNLVQDGRPLLGELVTVFGQGIVGLLTTALLSRFPLARLVTADPLPARRQLSLEMGATVSIDPSALAEAEISSDLAFELSGIPAALNQAIAATADGGRIIIGSWYGKKTAEIDLGGRFHRSRISLMSSQVSTIDPSLRGRWDKPRRRELCLRLLGDLAPARLLSHRFDFAQADQAFALLDSPGAGGSVQVALAYPH